jgi:hypothetical protein
MTILFFLYMYEFFFAFCFYFLHTYFFKNQNPAYNDLLKKRTLVNEVIEKIVVLQHGLNSLLSSIPNMSCRILK